ncbi:MAG: DUF2243 domain-containing protein [Flavobacteriales bacterium]|nr:MAG: DUF2243 domain-containing protein [Flavobacteriales bacterium]
MLYLNIICCTTCNKGIREGIANSAIFPNLVTMLSPFLVLAAVVVLLSWLGQRRHLRSITAFPRMELANPVPLTTAAIILGIGIGGFIDGIVFHQILQWHQMLSSKITATDYVGKSVNMFWDGIFHLFCLMVLMVGVVKLWQLNKRPLLNFSAKLLTGGMLIGWAIFNMVEGIINHHILKLHNVREQTPAPENANIFFLAGSLILFFVGLLLVNSVSVSVRTYRNNHN